MSMQFEGKNEKNEEISRERFYVVNDLCYKVVINYKYFTMYMYELDAGLSTDEKPAMKGCIFSTEFTISDTTKFEELTSAHKNSIQRIATSVARQFLDFRFNAGKSSKDRTHINIHLDYASARKQWKEKSIQAKYVDCEKCKLEDVILDTETKEDILRTINFVKNMKDYLEIGCKLPSGILLEGPPGTGKIKIFSN